jgi:nucleoside permease NupC
MQVLWGIGGIVALLAIAYLLSTNRRAISLRTVIGALIIQIAFAFIVLYWDLGRQALQILTNGVQAVIDTSNEGIQFLFGPVLPDEGIAFAFQVLPIIIFFASLTSVLYYLGILQFVVNLMGRGAPEGFRHQRARVALGDLRHLPRADGSAAHRAALHREDDGLGAFHRHGGRVGERCGLDPGRVLVAGRTA